MAPLYHQVYAALRETEPFKRMPDGSYFLTRHADLVAVLRQPEVRQRFGPLGIEPATNTPDEMDKLIADEVLNFKKLAAAAQIQID